MIEVVAKVGHGLQVADLWVRVVGLEVHDDGHELLAVVHKVRWVDGKKVNVVYVQLVADVVDGRKTFPWPLPVVYVVV